MASSSFLILLLKCFDFLSWPVLALGYPLCASIDAIESNSHSETRNLISYWILLSLIYLFEYAFLQLLQWFQYWHYMKLMIVAFLVIPDFQRSAYVYNSLIQSIIYVNPKEVISRFWNWENIFTKKQDFITQVENYITENGTEPLQKLIASKNVEKSLPAETQKEAPTTTEKIEILKTNKERLLMEQKDVKDLEMIEKEEVLEGKQIHTLQANTSLDNLKSKEGTSSATVKTENIPADTEHGRHPKISAAENVQKEWTCAICQMTMLSDADLNSHLLGRKHKAACEALNTLKTKAELMKNIGTKASPQVSASKISENTLTCAVCQLTKLSKDNMRTHLKGKKHKAACEALNGNNQGIYEKVLLEKNFNSIGEKEKIIINTTTSNGALGQKNVKNSPHKKIEHNNNINQQKKIGKSVLEMNSCRFRCDMCNVNCTREGDLTSHLHGKKHLAQIQLLSGSI